MSLDDSLYHPKNVAHNGSGTATGAKKPDLICFSHLRWNWVFQRPQHLMTRFAGERRVFYFEEPLFDDRREAALEVRPAEGNVAVTIPRLPSGLSVEEVYRVARELIDHLIQGWNVREFVSWYYSPLFLPYTSHLRPDFTVYDCMDELSAFAGADPAMLSREAELLSRADLVLTGGMSLYEAKRNRHRNVHPFPSSIDKEHFGKARAPGPDPEDQREIAHPRIGFHGVIDERFDHVLLGKAAEMRPDWQWILLGPMCKIDPAILPRRPNIHYLGKKEYNDLPAYLAGWDLGMMPFARNESTRYISPTKTPEYLAAGKPVVSTPIRDVVEPYGRLGLVQIAERAEEFVEACGRAFAQAKDRAWQSDVRNFLACMSWDETWAAMDRLVRGGVPAKSGASRAGDGRRSHV
jgi:glycosyltransferase involved in cell wall biosynthesis